MALSDSYDFNMTRNDIIKAALRKLNATSQFEEPTPQEVSDGAQALNMMMKSWQSQGSHLFKYEEIVIVPERNKTMYTLSPTGDNACLSSELTSTSTTIAELSGATTITVVSSAGIVDGDIIIIQLADNTSQTTTVSGAPAGNVIALADALTGAVNAGAVIYSFPRKIQKPMRMVDARRRDNPTGNDIKVQIVSRERYFSIPSKSSEGDVSQLHYNPKISSGNLFIWASPQNVTAQIRATVEYPIMDVDLASNNVDLPNEWLRALVFNLAVDLAPEYGNLSEVDFTIMKGLADQYLMEALAYDVEFTDVQFTPSFGDDETFGR